MMRRLALCLGLLTPFSTHAASSLKWQQALPASEPPTLELKALRADEIILLHWQRSEPGPAAWLSVSLKTADNRWYRSLADLTLPPGQRSGTITLPTDAYSWGGPHGPLDGAARSSITTIQISCSGSGLSGTVDWRLERQNTGAKSTTPQLMTGDTDLVDRGVWREWRFRLLGSDSSTVELLLADGTRIPAFPEQPGDVINGRFEARGAAQWVVRLRPGEDLSRGRVIAVDSGDEWTIPTLGASVTGAAPAADPGIDIADWPEAQAWSRPWTSGVGDTARQQLAPLPPALAPVLHWQASWAGFRGPAHSAPGPARQLDALLADGTVTAIDLIGQHLVEEQGRFRFGLSPWHKDQGGQWESPQDLLNDRTGHDQLVAMARELIARARAAPQLKQWRFGLVLPTGSDDQRRALETLAARLDELCRQDGRPLVLLHPELRPYGKSDPDGIWIDFSKGARGWSRLVGADFQPVPTNTEGIALEFDRSTRTALLAYPADASWWNLDYLSVDMAVGGIGGVSLYAWFTDEEHRFYQQRIGWFEASPEWRRVGIEFGDTSPWQAFGNNTPFARENLRRVRRFGLLAMHDAGPGNQDASGSLTIRSVARKGWPLGIKATPAIDLITVPAAQTERYAPYQVDFQVSPDVANPFDPDQADVTALITAPDGSQQRYPAFWMQGVELDHSGTGEVLGDVGPGHWRLRYPFRQLGQHSVQLEAKLRWRDEDIAVSSPAFSVTVIAGAGSVPEPVTLAQDRRHFETASGNFFYPLGINLRSPGDDRQEILTSKIGAPGSEHFQKLGTRAYETWFDTMAANDMNFARVWMSPWWCGLEWHRSWDGFGGLNRYNQASAARLDEIVRLAAERGIYLQIELNNHGMFSDSVDKQWHPDPEKDNPGNPYARENGGPAANARAFFSSEKSWDIYRKRLRYSVARWGADSNIFAWVIMSEMEFSGDWWHNARRNRGHSDTTERWIARNLEEIRTWDPLDRLTTIHFSGPWRGERLWRSKDLDLDFSYSNAYTGFQTELNELGGREAAIATAVNVFLTKHFPPWDLNRPTLLGEWGGHWWEKNPDTLSGELRVGLWAQAVLPYAGNTGFWYWLWLDGADRWGDYKRIARFMADEDPRGRTARPFKPRLSGHDTRLTVTGSRSPDAIRLYLWNSELEQDGTADAVSGGTVRINTQQPASRWRLQRYQGEDASLLDERIVTSDARGTLMLEIGDISPDQAWKLDLVR